MRHTKFMKYIPLCLCQIMPMAIRKALLSLDYSLTLRDARRMHGMPSVSLFREFNHWNRSVMFSNEKYANLRVECHSLDVVWGRA